MLLCSFLSTSLACTKERKVVPLRKSCLQIKNSASLEVLPRSLELQWDFSKKYWQLGQNYVKNSDKGAEIRHWKPLKLCKLRCWHYQYVRVARLSRARGCSQGGGHQKTSIGVQLHVVWKRAGTPKNFHNHTYNLPDLCVNSRALMKHKRKFGQGFQMRHLDYM